MSDRYRTSAGTRFTTSDIHAETWSDVVCVIVLDQHDKIVAVTILGMLRAVSRDRETILIAPERYCDNGVVKIIHTLALSRTAYTKPYRISRAGKWVKIIRFIKSCGISFAVTSVPADKRPDYMRAQGASAQGRIRRILKTVELFACTNCCLPRGHAST